MFGSWNGTRVLYFCLKRIVNNANYSEGTPEATNCIPLRQRAQQVFLIPLSEVQFGPFEGLKKKNRVC